MKNRILLLVVVAAGCSPTLQVRTDFDRATDFGRYQTFAMGETKQIGRAATGTPNTLVKDRIDNALKAHLAAEGLTPVQGGEGPDLVVRYVAGARTRQELESAGWGHPYWTGGYADDAWLRE